jgi:hypothetical protein
MYWNTRKLAYLEDKTLLKEHLKKVSDYLDECGMTLGCAQYPYEASDKTTWKYIEIKDCDKTYRESLDTKSWCVLNPDWKYAEQEKQDRINARNH